MASTRKKVNGVWVDVPDRPNSVFQDVRRDNGGQMASELGARSTRTTTGRDYRDRGGLWRTPTGQLIGDDEQRKQYTQALTALRGTGAYYDRGVFRTSTGARIGGDLETVKSWADTWTKTRGTGAYYDGGVWRTQTGARLQMPQPTTTQPTTTQPTTTQPTTTQPTTTQPTTTQPTTTQPTTTQPTTTQPTTTQPTTTQPTTTQPTTTQPTTTQPTTTQSLPAGLKRDRLGRITRNGAVLSGTQLKLLGVQAAAKGGRTARSTQSTDDRFLDDLIGELEA